jgi:DNA polymerase-3 subunit gamma/tau
LDTKDGEPCNECEICKGIISGSLTDVIEMDAASNNSVEDVRSIREEVNFLPTLAKYRVYIIDEVHMLSTGAFNALLKTLEEPPEHVKFILATTEPQKLPATILSRCQRFDFKRISNQNIIKRLKIIANKSNIEVTDGALNIISVLAEGAFRDAISILERCIQDGDNNINENKIKDLVGIPKLTYVEKITTAILEYNVDKAILATEEVIEDGKDLNNFLWEIIKYLKDILLLKASKKIEIYSEEEQKKMQELADKTSKERLLKLIYSISELDNTMKWSTQKTIVFQIGIMKACQEDQNEGIEEIEKRIKRIEDRLSNGLKEMPYTPKEQQDITKKERVEENKAASNILVQEDTKKNEKNQKSEIVKKQVSSKGNLDYWDGILDKLKQNGKIILYTNLINTKAVEINDMTVGIEFSNGLSAFGKTVLEKQENKREIERLVSLEAGKAMLVKYLENTDISSKTEEMDNKYQNLTQNFDIPINIIEE